MRVLALLAARFVVPGIEDPFVFEVHPDDLHRVFLEAGEVAARDHPAEHTALTSFGFTVWPTESLIPIARGNSLLLVGDKDQLQPVVVLDPAVNERLKKKDGIGSHYDYAEREFYDKKKREYCEKYKIRLIVIDNASVKDYECMRELLLKMNHEKYEQIILSFDEPDQPESPTSPSSN